MFQFYFHTSHVVYVIQTNTKQFKQNPSCRRSSSYKWCSVVRPLLWWIVTSPAVLWPKSYDNLVYRTEPFIAKLLEWFALVQTLYFQTIVITHLIISNWFYG